MTNQYEEVVNRVVELKNQEYTDFIARRLVEMAGHIIMTYLLIIDATRDNQFDNSAKVYFNYAQTEFAKHLHFINNFNADDVNTDHENLSAGSSFEEEVSPEDIAAFADFDKEDPSISETLTDDKINYLSADSANELSEEVPLDVPAE